MINCHEAEGQLWAYLDQSLSEVDRTRVEEHLARCRRCCAEMEFAHELRRVLAHGADLVHHPGILNRHLPAGKRHDPRPQGDVMCVQRRPLQDFGLRQGGPLLVSGRSRPARSIINRER